MMIVTLAVHFSEKQDNQHWLGDTLENHLTITGGYHLSDDGLCGYVDIMEPFMPPANDVFTFLRIMLESRMIIGFEFGRLRPYKPMN